jgi:hypothetical protein
MVAGALLCACTQLPTPYQPLASSGGYQETRLQERIYRVTFQGNPNTEPGAVLDMAFLRCAELSHAAGYPGFVLMGESSESKLGTAIRTFPEDESFPGRRGFFSFPRYETVTYVSYHVVTLLMRLLTADEAKAEKESFDTADLLRRLAGYRASQAHS